MTAHGAVLDELDMLMAKDSAILVELFCLAHVIALVSLPGLSGLSFQGSGRLT